MRLEKLYTYQIIRLLRLVLPFVILILIAVPLWNYWRAPASPEDADRGPRLVENISELVEGLKYSQVEGGRTVFTVEARTNLGFADGRYQLEDVRVILHSPDGGAPDRQIDARRCGYAQESGNIACEGDVAIRFDPDTTGRTASMTYNHQTRTLDTLAETRVTRPGEFETRTDRLRFDLAEGIVDLEGGVVVDTSEGARLEAATGRYYQRTNRIEAGGGFRLTSPGGRIEGRRAEADLDAESLEPRRVRARGSVAAISTRGEPARLRADELDTEIESGRVVGAVARGGAVAETGEGAALRTLAGDRLDAAFDPAGRLQVIDSSGGARMSLGPGRTLASARIRSEVEGTITTGEESDLEFGEVRVSGSGFVIFQGDTVRFETDSPARLETPGASSSGARTRAVLDPESGALLSLVQAGEVAFRQDGRTGTAGRIEMQAGGARILLEGEPRVSDQAFQIEAESMALDRGGGAFEASGAVRAVVLDAAEPVLIVGGRASGGEDRVVFSERAQMWQGATHVSAATIEIEPRDRRFAAVDGVRSTVGEVRVESDRLDFDEGAGLLRYSGNVRARSPEIDLDSARLRADLAGGEPERIVAEGDVRVRGEGFDGRGEEAVYVRDASTVTLTEAGADAEVVMPETGSVRGRRLMLNIDSRDVAVHGEDGSRVVSRRTLERD